MDQTKPQSSKAVIQAGWDDAPWLDDEVKRVLYNDSPPHLREARRNGTPALGSGNVYPIAIEQILEDDFIIPPYYKRIYALDVGWNTTACLFGALNPDDDVLHIYSEHYQGKTEPYQHVLAIRARFKSAGYEFNGVIDPAAVGSSQADGKSLMKTYRTDHQLRIQPANNEVESGIYNVHERLAAGKLKIFRTLKETQREYILYRRDLKGKIVKDKDHLMDCLRYMVMSLHLAKAKPILTPTPGGTGRGGRSY